MFMVKASLLNARFVTETTEGFEVLKTCGTVEAIWIV